MPKIEVEVTAEQAKAYAEGKSIAIRNEEAKKVRVLVSTQGGGLVYETRGPLSDAQWRLLRPAGSFKNVYPEYDEGRRYNFESDVKSGLYVVVPLKVRD